MHIYLIVSKFVLNILQVYISTVSLLTDSQLAELGVDKVGDHAILRKQCRDCIHSK